MCKERVLLLLKQKQDREEKGNGKGQVEGTVNRKAEKIVHCIINFVIKQEHLLKKLRGYLGFYKPFCYLQNDHS